MTSFLFIKDHEQCIAEVLNCEGRRIYGFHGKEIIESEIMCSLKDVEGLTKYLRKRKVIEFEDNIVICRRSKKRIEEGANA